MNEFISHATDCPRSVTENIEDARVSKALGVTPQSVSSRARNRSTRRKSDANELAPPRPSSWVDADDKDLPHHRSERRVRRRSTAPEAGASSRAPPAVVRRRAVFAEVKDSSGFFPRLGRILESRESDQERRRGSRDRSDSAGDASRVSSRRSRVRDEPAPVYRRQIRHRQSALQRQLQSIANQSVLSVLSSLTEASSASSGSNSTITQKSYDKESTAKQSRGKSQYPQRFDSHRAAGYMDTMEHETSFGQTRSTSSSGYEPSDAGSSVTAATSATSVSSTQPSPTSLYKTAPPDVWAYQEKTGSDSGISMHGSSPESHGGQKLSSKQPSVHEEQDEGANSLNTSALTIQPLIEPHPDEDAHTKVLRQQEDAMRQHISSMNLHSPQPRRSVRFQHVPPPASTYGQYPEQDHPYNAFPNQLYGSAPPVPLSGSGIFHPMPTEMSRPLDRSKKTIAGYELIAQRLTERAHGDDTDDHTIKPAYRKFEALNHRILLHLQDEISELEEELRVLDEWIAQSCTSDTEGTPPPASRRTERRCGGEIHFRRTEVLGKIFSKLQQYNQALSSYGTMLKNFDPAKADDVSIYQSWMDEHAPVEKAEASFLEKESDLVTIQSARSKTERDTATVVHRSAMPVFQFHAPLALLLALAAFSFIPDLLARLLILALIAVGYYAATAAFPRRDPLTPS